MRLSDILSLFFESSNCPPQVPDCLVDVVIQVSAAHSSVSTVAMEGSTDTVVFLDVLDVEKSIRFAALRGNSQVTFAVSKHENASRTTGRERVRIELFRRSVAEHHGVQTGRIPVFYRPDKLSALLGTRGRLVAGVQCMEEVPVVFKR